MAGKFALFVGTRPDIVKMAPVLWEFKSRSLDDYFLVHCGQHYDYSMSSRFFAELGLPAPHATISLPESSEEEPFGKVGKMVAGITCCLKTNFEGMLRGCKLSVVYGDTTSAVLACVQSIAHGIPVIHLESGLRAFDPLLLEESNRILIDNLSKHLLCTTERAAENLDLEGLLDHEVVGNTTVEIIDVLKKKAKEFDISRHNIRKGYVLVTLHRIENTDDRKKLARVFRLLDFVCEETGLSIVLLCHPKTKRRIFGKDSVVGRFDQRLQIISPCGIVESLALQFNAEFVMTDSGGVQEESCILGTPCIVLRRSTERPETITSGAAHLIDLDYDSVDKLMKVVDECLVKSRRGKWINPYIVKEEKASKLIVDYMCAVN